MIRKYPLIGFGFAKLWRKATPKMLEMGLKPPEVKPQYKEPTPQPKVKKKEEPPVAPNLEDEDYEPPPLFASDAVVRNY